MPFTYVNPAPDEQLIHSDRVFVLTSEIDRELESQEFKQPINIQYPRARRSVMKHVEERDAIFSNMPKNSFENSKAKSTRSFYQHPGELGGES